MDKNYSEMSLNQLTGIMIGAFMAWNMFGVNDEAREDAKNMLRAYIAKGGKAKQAAIILAQLEGI